MTPGTHLPTPEILNTIRRDGARLSDDRQSQTLAAMASAATTEYKALTSRILDEFEEMRGLSLSLVQASRLFGVSQNECAMVLRDLVDNGSLRVAEGLYRLQAARP